MWKIGGVTPLSFGMQNLSYCPISRGRSLDLGLGSSVAFVLPTGKTGQTAQILGQRLTGTMSMTFNGIAATKFTVGSDTYMSGGCPDWRDYGSGCCDDCHWRVDQQQELQNCQVKGGVNLALASPSPRVPGAASEDRGPSARKKGGPSG
jgi:hypothetical protein